MMISFFGISLRIIASRLVRMFLPSGFMPGNSRFRAPCTPKRFFVSNV